MSEEKKEIKEEELEKVAGGSWRDRIPLICKRCGHTWESIGMRNCPECGSDDVDFR